MTLILDAGPIVAALDQRDAHHHRCAELISSTVEELLIPAPVLVEVDWLLASNRGPEAAIRFLRDVTDGAYRVEDLTPDDYSRAVQVMQRYADADIGFVDASVLAITERLNEPKLATLDHRHFGTMRPRHVRALHLLPE